jgi:2-keto-4-pentenoate hydratase/2-oxohepta-3-ene-1,7-dioic acid hydratase in catechol pathway
VEDCLKAIIGYGLALDLTLRDVQEELKKKGHPWEIAKGFDNACPISPFLPMTYLDPLRNLELLHNLELKLTVNNQVRQHGNTQQMLVKVPELLAYMSQFFTLLAGDVVLTGTPAGVGELHKGDKLWLELESRHQFATVVI